MCLARSILPLGLVAIFAGAAQAGSVPNPVVTGPIAATAIPGDPSHNYIFFATNHELATNGYVEEEFFVEGTASSFTPTGPLSADGHWTVQPTASAPFRTRILVRRPRSADTFNGTADSSLTGTLYFPSQTVAYKGNFSGQSGCTQVVAGIVQWTGNASVNVDCTSLGMQPVPAVSVVKLSASK